jgi:glycosyltransferase involved in cell wall biosynthesis
VLTAITFKSRMKGNDVLIAAFDRLADTFPDLHLLIVGMTEAELVGPRPAHSRRERIHWAGLQDDVRPFLAASDIYVQPSMREAFGLSILEAMREGLPVVATRVGGIPELVVDGDTGLLVDPGSPQQLTDAIAMMIGDPDLAGHFARRGHERWRTQFSMRSSIDDLVYSYYRLGAVPTGPRATANG